MPLFISFYLALRGMANLPLESMKTGGTAWFPDLTVADPTMILPLASCASMIVMFVVRIISIYICIYM